MLIVAVAGCEKKPPTFEGPMPIAYGDCAGEATRFVSGPLPQPFSTGPATGEQVATEDDAPAAHVEGGFGGEALGDSNAGFGSGALGSGWGTIGTGRYGTIGHGSGYGTIGGRARLTGAPTVSIGQPNAQGDLDKAIIRRYIKRNLNKIQYCYEKQLLAKPTIKGTIQTQFLITAEGSVATADASGFDNEVAACIAGVIKSIEFPKPKGGGVVQVNYPFTFRHNDGPTWEVAAAGSGSGSAPARVVPPPPPPSSPPPSSGAKPAPPLGDARFLYRVGRAKPYEAGADNPLRLERDALTACLRSGPAHFGTAVVELHYDANGGVASSIVHGLTDDATRDCLAAAAKRAVQPKGAPAVQRCALAFGVQPAADLTTLALTKDRAQLAGKPIALDKLRAELDGAVKAVITSTDVVATHDPISLQVDPATPMAFVTQAWSSILGAGDDFVLAGLQPISLPVPPVPLSSGGHRARIKSASVGHGSSDERVVLSIYLTNDRIWLGLSRVNEFFETDLAGLEAKLKDQKASTFFQERTDVEIGAHDIVPFGDVATVIEIATRVGFLDWTLAEPKDLAVLPQP